MQCLQRTTFAIDQAGEVHDAAEVGGDEVVRSGGLDVVQLEAADGGGDVGKGHGEGSAEAAALFCITNGHDLAALQRGQQRERSLAAAGAA